MQWYVIRKNDNTYQIFDTTNTVLAKEPFDEKPFVEWFLNYKELKAEKERIAKEEAIAKEEQRIAELKTCILNCKTPVELAEEFGLSLFETAAHWSDLYEGRSRYAVAIANREDYEIVRMAVDLHEIEGIFGEARTRDGEHHSTFNDYGYHTDLSDYQKALKRHFAGDKFFYKSQEVDADWYCDEINDAAEDHDIDKVLALVKEYEELEAGYYDCNGNLEMLEADLEDADIAGYSYDVYNYCFAFEFAYKCYFKEVEEEEEEEN